MQSFMQVSGEILNPAETLFTDSRGILNPPKSHERSPYPIIRISLKRLNSLAYPPIQNGLKGLNHSSSGEVSTTVLAAAYPTIH